jgi:hypothetical protein
MRERHGPVPALLAAYPDVAVRFGALPIGCRLYCICALPALCMCHPICYVFGVLQCQQSAEKFRLDETGERLWVFRPTPRTSEIAEAA